MVDQKFSTITDATSMAPTDEMGATVSSVSRAVTPPIIVAGSVSANGLLARTGAATVANRTLTGPAAGISVADGDGVSGNPTLSLANDLSALEGLGSTGIAVRTAADTWAQRTISGTTDEIDVTNGDGVSGNPTISISSNFSTSDTKARDNIAILAFKQADDDGDAFGMIDGYVDAFDDETDVDTATSSNEVYDAAGDYYVNASSGTDGQTSKAGGSGVSVGGGTVGSWGGLLFPNDVAGDVQSVTMEATAVTTSATFVCKLYTDSSGSPGTQVGGDSDGVAISGTGNIVYTWSSNAPTLSTSTSYWVIFGESGGTGDIQMQTASDQGSSYASGRNDTITSITDAGFGEDWYAEVAIKDITDITLLNNAYTAAATPGSARIVVDHEAVDSVTLNTDLTAEVSRDGGTNWTTATLAQELDNGSGRQVLADTVDISGQPSGTSMLWRLTTANTKEQRIHGVSLRWDT